MDRLDLSKITTEADTMGDKTITLSPMAYVVILHVLVLLKENQWFFLNAGPDELDATDKALFEIQND